MSIQSCVFDFTLILDFERSSVKELQHILGELNRGSTLCTNDIVDMSRETGKRLDSIGYNLTNGEYTEFIHFVHSLYAVLRKLNRDREMFAIHRKYKSYSKRKMVSVSSPRTTHTDTSPKIMKKAKRIPINPAPQIK